MAYQRISDSKTLSTNLNGFIQTSLTLLKNQRTQRNLDDETKFQEAVLADNLTLEDQLAYRKDQLKRVTGDKDEVRRVRAEIASIKDQVEVREYYQEYVGKINDLNTGTASLDSTITWLNDRIAKTTDSAIKKNLQDNLSTIMERKFKTQQDTLEKQTTFAVEDKGDEVLGKAIERVSSARKEALLSGNDNYVSVLDLQLQNLNKAQAESKITKALTDMSVAAITNQSAVGLLNEFERQINSASSTTPVTIGGTRFGSMQEFWNTKRAEYINDRSTNGFFGRYQNEIKESVDYKTSKGVFKTDNIGDVGKAYDTLTNRPELKDYTDKINYEKQVAVSTAAEAKATQITNQFATDLDAGKAVAQLSSIQSTYGVDMTLSYQKIIQKAAAEKSDQLNSLLKATNQIASENLGMSYEQAFQKAVQSGAGSSTTYSPEQLATGDVNQLGKDTVTQKNKGPNLTVPPVYNEGDLVKTKDSATVYKFENGQLRPFAGNFTEDVFKQTTGKTFADVKTVETFGDTKVGQEIAAPQVTPTGQPGPNPPTPNPTATIVPGTATPQVAGASTTAPQFQEHVVKAGDNLSKLAQTYYHDPKKYTKIYEANKDILSNPNMIKPGQKLKIPN